jgi:legumain
VLSCGAVLLLLLLLLQSWEGQCGQLDQYGMKLTRMFANLCNAGVQPQQLTHSLATGPCSGMP